MRHRGANLRRIAAAGFRAELEGSGQLLRFARGERAAVCDFLASGGVEFFRFVARAGGGFLDVSLVCGAKFFQSELEGFSVLAAEFHLVPGHAFEGGFERFALGTVEGARSGTEAGGGQPYPGEQEKRHPAAGKIRHHGFGHIHAATGPNPQFRVNFENMDKRFVHLTRSSSHGRSASILMRSCSIESRWRMVTVFFNSSPFSPRVSKSTVTQYGVPISSWRR